jgi:hypothetical protein
VSAEVFTDEPLLAERARGFQARGELFLVKTSTALNVQETLRGYVTAVYKNPLAERDEWVIELRDKPRRRG